MISYLTASLVFEKSTLCVSMFIVYTDFDVESELEPLSEHKNNMSEIAVLQLTLPSCLVSTSCIKAIYGTRKSSPWLYGYLDARQPQVSGS